ncbi:MAG: hypothetical protein HQL64_15235 [Magnetococcales bacterium]|nr:hypothetical protein [Magnetococcales bacterium]
MITQRGSRRVIAGLLVLGWSLLVPETAPASGCHIGFDVGSSGIRVGPALRADRSEGTSAKVAIDYLADVRPNHEIKQTLDATIDALISLPKTAGLPEGCQAVAGGYSAWRMALQQGGSAHLVASLREIHQRTRVAFFVIPQDVEGTYGYHAAKKVLGSALQTPFILDIGGGSMQIAGQSGGWGSELGQKEWRRLFCAQIKGSPDPLCRPNPVGRSALAEVAQLLDPRIAEARAILGSGLGLTAISPPVVKAIHPAMHYLANERHWIAPTVDAQGLSRAALGEAIALLATQDDLAIVTLLDGCREKTAHPLCVPHLVSTLVTDMLLVHALMTGLNVERLDIASAEITNVPGILADQRALTWANHYACYLQKLGEVGIDAFKADPQGCGPEKKTSTH